MRLNVWTCVAWGPVVCFAAEIILVAALPEAIRCTPVEPGSRERICWGEYADPLVRTAVGLLVCSFAGLLVLTVVAAIRRRLTVAGWSGFLLSALILASGLYFIWASRNDCVP